MFESKKICCSSLEKEKSTLILWEKEGGIERGRTERERERERCFTYLAKRFKIFSQVILGAV